MSESQDVRAIAERFEVSGDCLQAVPYGTGHINDTYAATFRRGGVRERFIVQRLNRSIFKDPASLMENILRVTSHQQRQLRARGAGDRKRRALQVIPTREGDCYLADEAGDAWRMYVFVEGARTFDVVESPRQAGEAARAFGRFQQDLVDLPGRRLAETIPAFHDTPLRFRALEQAVERDALNRAATAEQEIEFALRCEGLAGLLTRHQSEGRVPERIVHNDTKLNNVMLDDATGEGICVIDLDTVMPGLVLYDFGDMVRSAVSPAAEDERDVGKVGVRMCMFEALVDGYLDSAEFLNATERGLLPAAGKVISFESGIRFLTDYLWGDVYFKTHREGHNLDRCRTQFQLVRSIEEHEEQMNAYVASWTQGRGRCSKYA